MERSLASIRSQGQGVWKIDILSPENVPDLLLDAAQGDTLAAHTLKMLFQAIIDLGKRKPPALCLTCSHVFRNKKCPPAAIVLIIAAVDDPHSSIASPLCHACASQDNLTSRVAQKLKETTIPDLRVLPQPTSAGRA